MCGHVHACACVHRCIDGSPCAVWHDLQVFQAYVLRCVHMQRHTQVPFQVVASHGAAALLHLSGKAAGTRTCQNVLRKPHHMAQPSRALAGVER